MFKNQARKTDRSQYRTFVSNAKPLHEWSQLSNLWSRSQSHERFAALIEWSRCHRSPLIRSLVGGTLESSAFCHGVRPLLPPIDQNARTRKTVLMPLALAAASTEDIDIFADATISDGIGRGAWAFSVPIFQLKTAGFSEGPSIQYLETKAVIEGVKTVLAIDRTPRLLRIHTDSQETIQLLSYVANRKPIPERKSLLPLKSLYQEAVQTVRGRRLVAVAVSSKRREHKDCHRRAAACFQRMVAADPVLAWKVALAQDEDRLRSLSSERVALQARLEEVECQQALIRARLAGLRLAPPVVP